MVITSTLSQPLLQPPPLVIPPAKYRTNITLAMFGPYSVGDDFSDMLMRDAQIELAVNEINQDPNILPNTYVKIARYNNFDPDKSLISNDVISGGYSMLQAMKVATDGVTAVVGEYFSRTTIKSGEVFSYYQIPLCGTNQASPVLSDKNRYPYFIRMQNGRGYGRYFYQYLKSVGANKVAIITDYDQLDVTGGIDIANDFTAKGVKILTKIYLSRDTIKARDYNESYTTLKNSDARYFVFLGNSQFIADFMFLSYWHGLISPRYVWLAWNHPWPGLPGQTGYIDKDYGPFPAGVDVIQGFITDAAADQDLSSQPIQQFNNTWNKLVAMSPRYQPTYDVYGLGMAPYDCTKLILYGMDKLLKDNSQYTPEMLANGSLKPYLNYTAFQNTGYNGVQSSPITLNEYGDLELRRIFFCLNYTLMYVLPEDITTGFGITNAAGTNFTNLRPCWYQGGSTIAPPDGPVEQELNLPWGSVGGIILVILFIIGTVVSVGIILIITRYAKTRPIRAMSPLFSRIFSFGTIVAYVSMLFFMGPPTVATCSLRVWLPVLSAVLTYGPLVVKNFRVYVLFFHKNSNKKWQKDEILLLVLAGFVVIFVGVLAAWQKSVNPDGYYVASDSSTRTHMCIIVEDTNTYGKNVISTIIALIAILLFATGYLSYVTSSVYDSFSESAFLSSAFFLGGFAFAAIIVTGMLMVQTTTMLVVRNLIMWFVAMGNQLFLFLPKYLELVQTWKRRIAKGLPGASANTLGSTSSMTGSSGSHAETFSPTSGLLPAAFRTVPYFNFGGALIRHRRGGEPFWSVWRKCGITVYSKSKKKWVMFDFDEESFGANITGEETDIVEIDKGRINKKGSAIRIKLPNEGARSLRAYLEFDGPEQALEFMQNWRAFHDAKTIGTNDPTIASSMHELHS
ncbi:hypothetical protein HDU76_014076 [Blyttiomyces sp. JEL0837]|nr:hypothetical protein HDU76_014076 [Blyttiomyces sp. JEL0837]